jgi:hypothetical protein
MNYPTEILPNPKYKRITCDLLNHYLIRYTSTNIREDIIDNDTKQVKQKHICSPKEQMNDLSTSLLGIYDFSHVQIELTTQGKLKFGSRCEPDENVTAPEYSTEFIINPDRGFWVILINKISGILADYTKNNINTRFAAKCSIHHTPVKWNYWHFSIHWDLGNGLYWHLLPDKEIKKLAKRLGSETRAIIAKYAEVDEPNYSQLENHKYYK